MFGFLIKAKGRALNQKFYALNPLSGKTRREIEAAVGTPNSVSAAAGGKVLCQWILPGFHIALLFNGEICEGVTHQFVN